MFVNPADEILATFPIDPVEGPTTRSLENTAADIPDATEVQDFLMDLLSPPDEVFLPQYFRSPVFPVKLLHVV